MTLSKVFEALASNENLNITLISAAGTSLITFNAGGYASVESDLGAREVTSIKIVSSTQVNVTIGD